MTKEKIKPVLGIIGGSGLYDIDNAMITAPEARDAEMMKRLDAVAGRVL
ncbi:MAG: hypothetical protein WC854_13595 [Bacteroidales bacterium]